MNTSLRPTPAKFNTPAVSPDGYIRLRLSTLNTLSFVHLYSESDIHFLQELKSQTVPASAAGFCEWQSETDPPVSLGWGWFIHSQSERMLLAPDAVRSNVMLIDAMGYDLGPVQTSSLFCTWLTEFEWQGTVGDVLHSSVSAC